MNAQREQLETLAERFGVQLVYHDIEGEAHTASDEALYAILPALGAQLTGPNDLAEALRASVNTVELIPKVLAFFDDAPTSFVIPQREGAYEARLELESDQVHEWSGQLEDLELADGGRRFKLEGLPLGYHELTINLNSTAHTALIIFAPTRAYCPPGQLWGLFSPTYALRDHRSAGAGSLRELERLLDFTQAQGGTLLGTLPLMASFLDTPFEPSPYAPVSRLFWNELLIDPHQLPEHDPSAEQAQPKEQGDTELVDYRSAYAQLRQTLGAAAQAAWSGGAQAELEGFASANPLAAQYARFRATCLKQGGSFHTWPQTLRESGPREGDFSPADYRFHLYAQLRMSQQLNRLGQKAKDAGGGLYLDMPLGVHPDGFDALHFHHCFLEGASAGAPPDALFSGGQNWGFRPLHPERIRADRYRYVIACIRHQLQAAGALRIDHVMGLHRLFCIPFGMSGAHGVYVRYRPEELYAILCLESHRHRCLLIGEDLGTVPDAVRASMDKHGLQRMYVGQFSLTQDPQQAMLPVPQSAAASMNTHDTPSFAGFWEMSEMKTRLELGHLTEDQAEKERKSREAQKEALHTWLKDELKEKEPTTAEVLDGLLRFLAKSDAKLLLINLEDLLGEPNAQNVPGTTDEHPNWRRRIARSLDEILEDPTIRETLEKVHALRSHAG